MSGPYVRKLPTEVRAGAKRVTFSWERGTHAVICTSREQAERVLADHNQAEIDRANDECRDWRGIGDAHGDGFREGERWFIERLLDLPEDPDAK